MKLIKTTVDLTYLRNERDGFYETYGGTKQHVKNNRFHRESSFSASGKNVMSWFEICDFIVKRRSL